MLNTARDALALADNAGSDKVMIHLDAYHVNTEEDDVAPPVREAGDPHIGEHHRGYLGSGHLDFDVFLGALAGTGYHGPLTFESFSSAVLTPGSDDLAIGRDLWDGGFDLPVEAREYMASGLTRRARAASVR